MYSTQNVLKHIIDECIFLEHVLLDCLSVETLIADDVIKRAVVRSLEIIGEASKKIPVDEKLKYPSIKWREMAGMRDKLIHDYIGVDYFIVWDVIKNVIPNLKIQIELVIE